MYEHIMQHRLELPFSVCLQIAAAAEHDATLMCSTIMPEQLCMVPVSIPSALACAGVRHEQSRPDRKQQQTQVAHAPRHDAQRCPVHQAVAALA